MGRNSNALSSVRGANLEWCHETLESVSRTFAISIDQLDEPMSSTLCVGYLLCRIADTVEDEPTLAATEKDRLLAEFDRVLDPDDRTDVDEFVGSVESMDTPSTDDWHLVVESERVIRTFERLPPPAREAITTPARELVDGMRVFVRRYSHEDGIRIETADELEEYCYYVAGVVGHLITNVQLWNSTVSGDTDRMLALSESFGHLLQHVNIAKDVYTDYVDEGNVYLPAAWLAAVDVSQEEVLASGNKQAVASVVVKTADRARSYLDDAQAWLESLPPTDDSMVTAYSVPFLLAIATLRELSDRPEDALSEGGVKISRGEVMNIVAAVTDDFDQSSLGPLRESIHRGELR